MIAIDVFVRIPISTREAIVVARPDLHKADTPLKHPPGNEAFLREIDGLFEGVDFFIKCARNVIQSVHLEDMFRLTCGIERLRGGQLHARGELVAANPRFETLVARAGFGMLPAQLVDQGNTLRIALVGNEIALFGWKKIRNRDLLARKDDRSLLGGD